MLQKKKKIKRAFWAGAVAQVVETPVPQKKKKSTNKKQAQTCLYFLPSLTTTKKS
jgi:hypothetical protein